MKILLISQNFYPEIGSGANRFKNLYLQLSKHHEVNVLTTPPSYPNTKIYKDTKYWDNEEINKSSDIFRLNMRSSKHGKTLISRMTYYLELAYKVRYFVKKYQTKYDAIYVTTPNIFLPWSTLFLQHKPKKVKWILEVRDLWPDSVREVEKFNIEPFFPILKYLEKKMYSKADGIVVNNEGFRKHIKLLAPEKKILFLPNAFTTEEVEFKERPKVFKVIYTGNIGLAQSYEQLRKVADLLEKEKIEFNVIAYGVNSRNFNDYIQKSSYEYVTTYNERSREECLELIRKHNVQLSILKESDIFLNVLPGKIIDGIGCGVPVVTNLGGYANQLINNNKLGYAKEKADPLEIVEAIKNIKNDSELEKQYRHNSKVILERLFLWEKNIYELIKFIK